MRYANVNTGEAYERCAEHTPDDCYAQIQDAREQDRGWHCTVCQLDRRGTAIAISERAAKQLQAALNRHDPRESQRLTSALEVLEREGPIGPLAKKLLRASEESRG